MNFDQAEREANLRMFPGIILFAICLLSTLMSAVKFLLSHATNFEINKVFFDYLFRITDFVQDHGPLLVWFWQYAPTPDPLYLTDFSNLIWFVLYLGVFVALALFFSGLKLSRRLTEINRLLDDQIIRQSIHSEDRKRSDTASATHIPKTSVFSHIFPLYILPLIVTGIGAMLLISLGYF